MSNSTDTDDYYTGDLFGVQESITSDSAIVSGLSISILEKSGLALTLIADHIFSPALVLSELIWLHVIQVQDKRVLELGCGTGLVGLVALQHAANFVCLTDFDDEAILSCPRRNLAQNNDKLPLEKCQVVGHTWGSDASCLVQRGKYDIVILADILWYTTSHRDILQSVETTLAEDGVVWISSGKYTTCALDFFALAGSDWVWNVVELGQAWQMPGVEGVAHLDERKQNCLCWRMMRRHGQQDSKDASAR